ncbi:hypothetical protein COS16_09280 [Candidatus Desantisbacteria bacterium CG02_land_8_20_14_3_00_49_13]|nr:MAG: hypothetical protein AUJ67_08900 [Candidatus Desantisbacteria bacterium CG1_02_49_89]PIV54761.1 MAG: hypothetical protein COS16_09280 [Candidatus Desantisbacteria bacterium CG02_land_8_20_14_3_00_49_13]
MKHFVICFLLFGSVVSAAYAANPTVHGLPPPAKPQRVSAAEGFPPLPLPVVPMRRSEQKRPPQPLALATKVKYGTGEQWRGTIADLKQLLAYASPRLNISYTTNEMSLKEFSFDPKVLPVMYFTGHQRFRFSSDEIEKMRQYLANGGTIIGNACCGNVIFSASFKDEMQKILPDRPMVVLPPDHPIYASYYTIEKVNYRKPEPGQSAADAPAIQAAPNFEGINVGCRTAVILSKADISAGWDELIVPTAEFLIEPDDALKLGTNLMAYCLAFHQAAQQYTKTPVYEDVEREKGGEFIFAQVMHGGDWDPHAGAVSRFIQKMKESTSSDAKLRRVKVDLASADLFSYPFLYMTGHYDFKFTSQEISNLASYLKKGGFLFANACCGSADFDIAFKREMKRVLPGFEMKALGTSHSIFDSFYTIQKVAYTQKVELASPGFSSPYLEGIDIEGGTAVVYSPYGLVWDEQVRPYSLAVMPEDSLRLGINTVVFALSH